jgi:Arc/MetJ-type ribon-helix-helix transcriptional regulator
MTIETHTPELDKLIRQRMQSGAFQNVDDLLIQLLREKSPNEATKETSASTPHRTRAEAAAHMREARKGNRLPEGVTIEDLIDKCRA